MITLLIEVIKLDSYNIGFYNPSLDSCRAYPRTESGVKKAIRNFKKVLLAMDNVEDFRVAAYEGKKEYYNDRPFIGYIDKATILKDF